jgi:hypothetical protein
MNTSTYRIELNGESTIHDHENPDSNYAAMDTHWQNVVDHIEARGGNAKLFRTGCTPESKMSRFISGAMVIDGVCYHEEKLIAELGGKQSPAVVIG